MAVLRPRHRAYSGDGGLKTVGVNFGTWNSLHKGPSGSDGPSGKFWYESDFYTTLSLGFGGGFTFGTTYTSYTSPNNMFSTVKEIAFKLGEDDSAYLNKFAMKPYALFAFELDTEKASPTARPTPARKRAPTSNSGSLRATPGRRQHIGPAEGWAQRQQLLRV